MRRHQYERTFETPVRLKTLKKGDTFTVRPSYGCVFEYVRLYEPEYGNTQLIVCKHAQTPCKHCGQTESERFKMTSFLPDQPVHLAKDPKKKKRPRPARLRK